MPQTTILVFRNADGISPLLEWMADLKAKDKRAYAKCVQRVIWLSQLGSELGEPAVKPLEDGIFELRAKVGTVNYRILFYLCGKNVAVLSHGFTKEKKVPPAEIKRAKQHRKLVESDLKKYTAEWSC